MAKFLIPAVAGAISLSTVAAVGLVAYLDTDQVTLTVDGVSQVLDVREDSVGEVLAAQGLTIGERDVVLPATDTVVVDGLEISVAYGRPLELTLDGEERTVWTTARTVGEALSILGLAAEDSKVSVSRGTAISREGLALDVATAQDITLTAAGETQELRVAGTVADALAAAGIAPDDNDLVTPAVGEPLTPGLGVTFVAVEVSTSSKTVDVPFEKTEVTSESMTKGTSEITTPGVVGSATETYEDVYHDGVLVESKLISTTVEREPVTQVTTVGSAELSPATGNTCKASYYWQGQVTANGESFDTYAMTAAHKSLPFNTMVKVTNPSNGQSVVVRINDRGPYIEGRCLDLSTAAMEAIGGTSAGVITVNWEVVS